MHFLFYFYNFKKLIMAHPKRRQSKSRKKKRRNFYRISNPRLGKDPITKQYHLYHRAHWYENKLYYKGKIILEKKLYS